MAKQLYWVSTETMLLVVSNKKQALPYEGAYVHRACSCGCSLMVAPAIGRVVDGKLVES